MVYEIVANFVYINLGLAIFNLLPVPPLDGYHVFNDLLLKKSLYASPRAARIGQGVLLVLVWTGALSRVLGVVEDGVSGILAGDSDESLLAALIRAFGEEGKRIAKTAAQYAAPFSTEGFAEKVEACYLKAIEAHKRG